MDREDRFGSFEHDLGRQQSDYYRQSYNQGDSSSSSRRWSMLAAGAVMLGAGAYMLVRGMRSEGDGLPKLNRSMNGESAGGSVLSGMAGMARGSSTGQGIEVREQVTVNKPISELYRFWRNVENLPRVMTYLESVNKVGDRRSHWVAKGPAGQNIEWDAEVTDARENELIAWRSMEGSEVPNEGSVRFSRSPDGQGTIIDVAMSYHPPGGKLGAAVAKLFGREPTQEIRRDLHNFKEKVESGNLILGTSQGKSF